MSIWGQGFLPRKFTIDRQTLEGRWADTLVCPYWQAGPPAELKKEANKTDADGANTECGVDDAGESL